MYEANLWPDIQITSHGSWHKLVGVLLCFDGSFKGSLLMPSLARDHSSKILLTLNYPRCCLYKAAYESWELCEYFPFFLSNRNLFEFIALITPFSVPTFYAGLTLIWNNTAIIQVASSSRIKSIPCCKAFDISESGISCTSCIYKPFFSLDEIGNVGPQK